MQTGGGPVANAITHRACVQTSLSGGIGRHSSLKSCRSHGRVGSSPTSGTEQDFIKSIMRKLNYI